MWPWPWYLLCIANSVLHGVDCLRLNFPKVHEIYRFANLTVVLISYIFIFNRSSITYFNNKQIKAGFLPSYLLVIFKGPDFPLGFNFSNLLYIIL